MKNQSKFTLIAFLTIVIVFISSCSSQATTPIPTPSPAAPPSQPPQTQPVVPPPVPAPPEEFKLDLVATAPSSYKLDVAPVYSGHGFCYLGALTMLFKYDDPSIEFSDVTAYGSVGSSGVYMPEKNVGIPFDHFNFREGTSWAVMVHAPRNLGYSLIVSAAKGGRIDPTQIFQQGGLQFVNERLPRIINEAKVINYFDSEDDSFNFLKRVVASGYPVEVHVNLGKLRGLGAAIAHSMVVTGYDAGYVYLNDPTDPGMPINLPAGIATFKSAWNTPEIMNPPNNNGPYWMLFVKRTGEMKSASNIIAWNKQRSANTPKEIRLLSENFPRRLVANEQLSIYQFGEARVEYANFLRKNGKTEAAALYEQSGKIWVGLINSNTRSDDLKKIADLEEKAQSLY